MRELTEQELHNLAMNIVGRKLEQDGYEFMAVNSKPKKNPQFVCLKNKKLHFIIVRPVKYPEDPRSYNHGLMYTMKQHAEKMNATAYYAGVGLFNAEDRLKPVYLNQPYVEDYSGLIKV